MRNKKIFKVIWKYKNENKKKQYQILIYLGKTDEKIKKILEKIKQKNLYDSLTSLEEKDENLLINEYGEKWYLIFFNKYHINFSFDLIKNSQTQQNQIILKKGKKWYEEHIINHIQINKNIIYSYEETIKDQETLNEKIIELKKKQNLNSIFTEKFNIAKIKLEDEKENFKHVELGNEENENKTHNFNNDDENEYKIKELKKTFDEHNNFIHLNTTLPKNNDFENELNNEDLNFKITLYKNNDLITYDDDFKYTIKNFDENIDQNFHGGEFKASDINNEIDNKNEDEFKILMDNEYEENKYNDNDEYILKENEIIEEEINLDDIEEENEINENELGEVYKNIDKDEEINIKKNNDELKKILEKNDENIEKKNILYELSDENEKNIYDEKLRNIHNKVYIYTQFLYEDDTIKTIKNKICVSVKNNNKYDIESHIIPNYIYIWSEYYFNNIYNKIMLGQKWLIKNEILQIDIEPNNVLKHYEELIGPLERLKNIINKYTNRVRFIDDETNILSEYELYYDNNEIYMIDIINELGLNYTKKYINNLMLVYMKMYFPKIQRDELENIIDYLNKNKKIIKNHTYLTYKTISTDTLIENEIVDIIENIELNEEYKKLFLENYITQIEVYIRLNIDIKLDLYKIFDSFETNDDYVFLNLQSPDQTMILKFNEKKIKTMYDNDEDKKLIFKWIDNVFYGISFKIKISEFKYISVNLNEFGRIEYKIHWKEDDKATILSINDYNIYIEKLIKKINKNGKLNIPMPEAKDFKFSFINSIQKFRLPNKHTINHNDLSDFSRLFYPYITLVIEPTKRKSKLNKENTNSKYGTYLRYKRISKYNNQMKIELKIIYLLRNFEYDINIFTLEIAKYFNLTEEKAYEEIIKVKNKYPFLKKNKKILKKIKANEVKHKQQGIGIDIQGKTIDNYKIKFVGIRNKEQLNKIITFTNILIYLYSEIYLIKNKSKLYILEKLEKLTKIAKRRNKVDEYVYYEEKIKNEIKTLVNNDKLHTGFSPLYGQNNWSRQCPNSGSINRQPQQFINSNSNKISKLLNKGYIYNKETKNYEKKITIIDPSTGKKKNTIVSTISVPEFDKTGEKTGNQIFYECNNKNNGEYIYANFLIKGKNPAGVCMPCCYKKDPFETNNIKKQNFYKNCMLTGKMNSSKNNKEINNIDENNHDTGEIYYILQNTNKIPIGRLGMLSDYLNMYFNNLIMDNKILIKKNLLIESNNYFLKIGQNNESNQFINSILTIFNISLKEIKNRIIEILDENIFIFLNQGEIKTQFKTIDNYLDFIKNTDIFDITTINHILCIPGIITKNGLNICIFKYNKLTIKKKLENDLIIDDYNLILPNYDNKFFFKNPYLDHIILLNDNITYYPIVLIKYDNENDTKINITKCFNYKTHYPLFLNKFEDFYYKNYFNDSSIFYSANETYYLLQNTKIKIKSQFCDENNKCMFLITDDNFIIPVKNSGSILNIKIIDSIEKYINSLSDSLKFLKDFFEIIKSKIDDNKTINYMPIGVYYTSKNKEKYTVNSLFFDDNYFIPITIKEFEKSKLIDLNLSYKKSLITNKLNKILLSNDIIYDDRINFIKRDNYIKEGYNLLKLELSNWLKYNESYKLKIQKEIDDKQMNNIKLILYEIFSSSLFITYSKFINSRVKNNNLNILTHIIKDLPNLNNYIINNIREVCSIHNNKKECSNNLYCNWVDNSCKFSITENILINYVNKMAYELFLDNLNKFEIFNEFGLYVSNIVNYDIYTTRENQKIIKTNSENAKTMINNILHNKNKYILGKNKNERLIEELNTNNKMIENNDHYLQLIINNNFSLIRGYVNSFYWVNNSFYDKLIRNLGYYNNIQSDMMNYFKGLIVNWLNNKNNLDFIKKNIFSDSINIKNSINSFISKLYNNYDINDYKIIFIILNLIHEIPIVIYDDFLKIFMIIDKKIIDDHTIKKYINNKKLINIQFIFNESKYPININSIYFL